MARLRVAATRSNLLQMRQRLALARQGHQLLQKKRDVLIMEILRMIEDAERIQTEIQTRFAQAYEAMEEARAAMGTERVHRIALAKRGGGQVHITPHSIMGVVVPSVRYETPPRKPLYGLGTSSVYLDQAEQAWADIASLLGPLSEKVTTVWRLALELRRTQRRVNALENVFIPAYEETVAYIVDSLEEKDREDLFRLKRAKAARTQSPSP